MRKAVLATTVFLLCQPAFAQIEPPGKFPGVGSYDDWRVARPETTAGMKCFKQKQWDDAIRHFKASLKLYDYQPQVYVHMGRAIEERGGQLKEAEECYRKALKLNSESWHAWKCLANVLYVRKDYGQSRQALASALQLKVPDRERAELQNMVKRVESAAAGGDTSGMNQTSY